MTRNIIINTNSQVWNDGIGSVEQPFVGEFDGAGYCIIGLKIASGQTNAGLFEVIGEEGKVHDLMVFNTHPETTDGYIQPSVIGGIAAINNGTIDHCISGINITTGTIHIGQLSIPAASLNSEIEGGISGGIAGENNGLITGCRNASFVTGTQCGGIAGVNTGKIYGSSNNAKIGTATSEISGGLVGKNSGTIESSYNSGNINGVSETAKGSIAGINESNSITNVFYITANGIAAVGTSSTATPNSTNIAKSSISAFQKDSFTDELNAVSDDTVTWTRNSSLNKSCPTIKCNFLKPTVKSAGNNIALKGNMHKSLNVQYSVCDENSENYNMLISNLNGKNPVSMYSLSLTDADGNFIPAELWCDGEFEISVPVNSENVQLVGVCMMGDVATYEPVSVEKGIATFKVSHPTSFAIVENANNNDSDNDTDNDSNTDDEPVNTGDSNSAVETVCVVAILVSMFTVFVIAKSKRKNKI